MNRKDLVEELSGRFAGNRQVAEHALDSVVDVITTSVAAGEKVVISGFGEFERKLRQAGALVAGSRAGEYVPEFQPSKELREVVSGVRAWRARVSSSLAVVPAAAAGAAEQASRATAGTLRSVAEKARELASDLAAIGEPNGAAKPAASTAATAAPATPTTAAAKKTAAKSAAAKSAAAKKAPAKKAPAKKAPAKKAPAKKAPAAKKVTAKKVTARKVTARKAPARSR